LVLTIQFPTGFFAARNAFGSLDAARHHDAVAVVIGCGPVGLCALVAALEYKPKHIFAIDSVPLRLELARTLGAEPLNFAEDREGVFRRVLEASEGRGADVVMEVVGQASALRMAYELVRPFGTISSVGVHNSEVRFLFFLPAGKGERLKGVDPDLGRGGIR
jgi:threonine dehydrogenase-like Zn-dependent dehydrogenase